MTLNVNHEILDLRNEMDRLSTFKDCPGGTYGNPSDLARDGFYFGRSEIRCAFCPQSFALNGEEPVEHRDCPFWSRQDVGNLPHGASGWNQWNSAENNNDSGLQSWHVRSHVSASAGLLPNIRVRPKQRQQQQQQQKQRQQQQHQQQQQKPQRQQELEEDKDISAAESLTCNSFRNTDLNRPATGLTSPAHPKYLDYSRLTERIRSFSMFSPRAVQAGQTADAGFFNNGKGGHTWLFIILIFLLSVTATLSATQTDYKETTKSLDRKNYGRDDEVVCCQCGGSFQNWDPGDEPWHEHRKKYPECAFVKHLARMNTDVVRAATGIILSCGGAFEDIERAVTQRFCQSGDEFQNFYELAASAFELSVLSNVPQELAEESTLEGRRRSEVLSITRDFAVNGMDTAIVRSVLGMGFPRDIVETATSERLTTTGRNFTSEYDLIDAVIFLQSNDATRASSPIKLSIEVNDSSSSEESGDDFDQGPSISAGRFAVDRRDVKARMCTAAVNTILDKDVSRRRVVKKVIKNRLSTVGDDFPNVESMLEAVHKLEGNKTEPPHSSTETSSANSGTKCPVCWVQEFNTVLQPCCHVSCDDCVSKLNGRCPICRQEIENTIAFFLP